MIQRFIYLIVFTAICQINSNAQLPIEFNLVDSVNAIFAKKKIPGSFVCVLSKDSILLQHIVGYADIDKNESVTEEHLFKIGSVTKMFTALAVMTLIDQGKLSLEDKLIDVAPEISFYNKWSASQPIRIKHLLEHKAGFDDMHLNVIARQRKTEITALEEVKEFEKSLVSRWQPGLVHSYSNPGYAILGYIIEKKTQEPYQDYIAKNILAPLNMNKTHFASQILKNKSQFKVSKGYVNQGPLVEESINIQLIGESAGAIYSNAKELISLAQFFLNSESIKGIINGKIITEEMEKLHSQFEIQNNITIGYGLGLYNKEYGNDKIQLKGHSGGVHGFATTLFYSKKQDRAFIICNNLGASNTKIMNLLVDHFCDPKLENNSTGTYPNQSQKIEDWNGHYKAINTRNKIFDFLSAPLQSVFVSSVHDSLIITPFLDKADTYFSISHNRYQSTTDSSNDVYLTTYNDQKNLYFYEDLMMPISKYELYFQRLYLVIAAVGGILSLLTFLVTLIFSILKRQFRPSLTELLFSSLPYWFLSIMLLLFLSNLSLERLPNLGHFTITSFGIFISSILILISTLLSMLSGYKAIRRARLIRTKILYFWSITGAIIFTTYLLSFGWIGIRIWAY